MIHGTVEILLVEDSDADAELTIRALRREKIGNRIEHVADGEEALDFLFGRGRFTGRASSPAPRLVLLDLKMPRVSGLEVLEQIKKDPRTRSIPVVIMTSSREEMDVAQSYALGANSYVQKPVGFEEFREMVKQLGMYWMVTNEAPPANVAGA